MITITAEQFTARCRRVTPDKIGLAQDLLDQGEVKERLMCAPIQTWEEHPVISRYLDRLSDKQILAAIETALAEIA